jgi:penicillin-binding protein 1C
LHSIFDHLRAQKGTSWYQTPAQIVERVVHPLTGKLLSASDPRGVRERFVGTALPPEASAQDYDDEGRVRLTSEFDEWFASSENALRDRTVLAGAASELRVVSPLPGSTYVVDPDVRSSGRIPLRAAGGRDLVWTSESLRCVSEEGLQFAVAAEGEHRLVVTDPKSGCRADVVIAVRSL